MTALGEIHPHMKHLAAQLHRPCTCGRPSKFMCDHRTGGYGVSCDVQICELCVGHMAGGRHFCPTHRKKNLERPPP